MKRLLAIVVGAACLALVAQAGEMKPPVIKDAGFDKLKSLAGDWMGAAPDGKPVHVSYRVTSGGTCVMETLVGPESIEMVTMYYVDGKKLTMTHFCSMGNQPRMRAEAAAADPKILKFDFVDAGNMPSKNDPHMHALEFRFVDADHFSQSWQMREAGKEMPVLFVFTRAKA